MNFFILVLFFGCLGLSPIKYLELNIYIINDN